MGMLGKELKSQTNPCVALLTGAGLLEMLELLVGGDSTVASESGASLCCASCRYPGGASWLMG